MTAEDRRRTAVVTGIGAVSPIGNDAETFWRNLTGGCSGVARIASFDASGEEVRIAAEVTGFDPAAYLEPKSARRMSRFSQLAVAAAAQAVESSGLEVADANRADIAVIVNTGGGGIAEVEAAARIHATAGPKRVSPFTVPMFSPSMAACQVSIANRLHGPVIASVAACASGVQAYVDALRLIQHGDVEVVIAGGAESAITAPSISALANMGALSKRNDEPERASRPFDAERDGFVFGEGAAIMVVESEEHAARRSATPLARLLGGALTADAFHISAPEPSGSGAALAMQRAVRDAQIETDAVDYVAAHGTSTPLNDATETRALKAVFGSHAHRLMVSSNKSMIGHTLGAAGAFSALAAVLAIRDGVVPPTINQETPDPECDLDYVPNVARRARVDTAIVNGFGFGGQNAVAVLARPA
ncbi:MAG: beta-ketoacyl-ACP synthase II [Candidatus Limnocylindria bacterium]